MPRPLAGNAAGRTPPTAFALLAFGLSYLKESGYISGAAPSTRPMPSLAAITQLACMRERLAADLREAQRQHKATCSIREALRLATNSLLRQECARRASAQKRG